MHPSVTIGIRRPVLPKVVVGILTVPDKMSLDSSTSNCSDVSRGTFRSASSARSTRDVILRPALRRRSLDAPTKAGRTSAKKAMATSILLPGKDATASRAACSRDGM